MTPVSALQAVLSGEHAAVYLYGVVGGQVSRSKDPKLADLVQAAYAHHVSRRNRLNTLITDRHASPVASATAYELPGDVGTDSGARAAGRRIEARCQQLYGQLIENTTGTDRAWAIGALTESSLDGLDFGLTPDDFPGMTWT